MMSAFVDLRTKLTLPQEIAPGQESTLDADINIAGGTDTRDEDGEKEVTEGDTSGQPAEDPPQMPAFGAGFGFDSNSTAGFQGGMGFGGDMNQMQMMMALQSGMAPNAFGNFPMMGM